MRNYAGSALMLVATMAAAVGCYTINLRVSAERAGVESLRYQLVADAREMRNLQAELRTRARFPEMQRWNDSVLQMSAPSAGQFLRSPVELASYAAAPATAPKRPELVYTVTTPDAAAPVEAPLVRAAYREPEPAAAPAAQLLRTSYSVPRRSAPAVDLAEAPAPRREAPVRRAAPARSAAAPVEVPAPAAPVDLLPQGDQ